jgi:hypothetical protein
MIELSLSLQEFFQMKHSQKFLTPYLTKVKLALNPEGAQGALLKNMAYESKAFRSFFKITYF